MIFEHRKKRALHNYIYIYLEYYLLSVFRFDALEIPF